MTVPLKDRGWIFVLEEGNRKFGRKTELEDIRFSIIMSAVLQFHPPAPTPKVRALPPGILKSRS